MYCKKCGAELPDSAKFCSRCGMPVKSKNAEQGQVAIPGQKSMMTSESAKRKGKKKVIVLSLVAVLVLAIGTVASVSYLHSKEDLNEPTEMAAETSSISNDVVEQQSDITDSYLETEADVESSNETENVENSGSEEIADSNSDVEVESEDQYVLVRDAFYDAAGNVTSETNYEYDENGNQVRKSKYWSGEDPFSGMSYSGTSRSEYEYDENGKKIGARDYKDGVLESVDEFLDGHAIKTICYKDGEIDCYYEREYDDTGNRVKFLRFNGDETLDYYEEYEFNESNEEKKETHFDGNGLMEWYEITEFDEDGRNIGQIKYDSAGNEMSVFSFEYDSKGRMIKMIQYDTSVGDYYEKTTKYDDAKNTKEETTYYDFGDDSEPLQSSSLYESEYDEFDNLIKQVTYTDGEFDSTEIREYTWLSSLFAETEPEVSPDLAQYMGGNLDEFVTMIGDMQNDGATVGVQYSNDEITVASHADPNTICYLEIHRDCKYQIKGIQYGMPFSEATAIAYANCISMGSDLDDYKLYLMSDETQLGIYANEAGLVDRIYLLVQD